MVVRSRKRRGRRSGGGEGVGWLAQTACGLEGGREAEIILRSQAFFPPFPSPGEDLGV